MSGSYNSHFAVLFAKGNTADQNKHLCVLEMSLLFYGMYMDIVNAGLIRYLEQERHN